MVQRRRRHARRDALVFLGSLVAHVLIFFFAARELTIPYRLPLASEPAIQLEIQSEPTIPIIPPPPVMIPKPQPLPPTPQPQAQPTPSAQAPAQPTPKAQVNPTAPAKTAVNPAPTPAPRPAQIASPLAPPVAAPQPGPPEAAPPAPVVAAQPHVITAPTLRLHRSNQETASPLAPPVSIPGAVFAPSQPGPAQPGGQAAGGGPGHGGAGGLPGGVLPGFGGGLRGSLLGCIDSAVAKLSAEERARCAERLGDGAKIAPVMDPIGAAHREVLNDQAAREQTAQKYRDSTPSGNYDQPIPGQPRLGHKPGGD
jgi:hypothetical protein